MTDLIAEQRFMEEAIDELRKSEGKVKVGAVIVIDGKVVATGHKNREGHAERNAIKLAQSEGVDLRSATLYTTLEPCVPIRTEQTKQCCSDLISLVGIQDVVIGRYDPHSIVYRKGWKRLRDAGVRLRDFPAELRAQIDEVNGGFMAAFSRGIGPTGGAKVYHKDGATFEVTLSAEDPRTMEIGWKVCGHEAAYGYAISPIRVSNAVYAQDFSEVDDPSAFNFSHSARIGVGEIGIFDGPNAFVLVKVKEALSGPDYKSEHYHVSFDYQVRLKRET